MTFKIIIFVFAVSLTIGLLSGWIKSTTPDSYAEFRYRRQKRDDFIETTLSMTFSLFLGYLAVIGLFALGTWAFAPN